MTGAKITIETRGLEKIQAVFAQLGNPNTRPLMDALGFQVEQQTRRRLDEEKRSPDGTPWQPWSDRYARTRHGGQSLLVGEGDLLDSVTYEVVSDDTVEIGSNLVYAAIHQFGGDEIGSNMPERPYLGLSEENEEDLESVITDWAKDLLQ